MALILHLDTSGSVATVMLAKGGEVVSLRQMDVQREQSALLNGMITSVMGDAGTSFRELDAVAVCNGPGSYTGLRIALATAKALCYVEDKPLLLQNRLELIAGSNRTEEAEIVVAVLPARVNEYFAGAWNRAGKAVLAPAHFIARELKECIINLPDTFILAGFPGEDLLTGEKSKRIVKENDKISVAFWAEITAMSYSAAEFADLRMAEPFYLKNAYTTVAARK
jgi:tRNA threonylcarbamoyladenosine biosynthesis protein TsaB